MRTSTMQARQANRGGCLDARRRSRVMSSHAPAHRGQNRAPGRLERGKPERRVVDSGLEQVLAVFESQPRRRTRRLALSPDLWCVASRLPRGRRGLIGLRKARECAHRLVVGETQRIANERCISVWHRGARVLAPACPWRKGLGENTHVLSWPAFV